LFVQPEREN